jgi:hypothetical protein
VFKASDKELDRLKELIKERFADIKIIYITTGTVSCILQVTKTMPYEKQNSSAQPLYAVE